MERYFVVSFKSPKILKFSEKAFSIFAKMSPSIQPDIPEEDLNNTVEDQLIDLSYSVEESPKCSRQPVKHYEPESVIRRRYSKTKKSVLLTYDGRRLYQ